MGDTTSDIARANAAAWFARLGAPDCTPEQRREFARWRAAPENAAAYEATLLLAEDIQRLAAASSRFAALAKPQSAPPAPRRAFPAILAAAVLGAAVLGWLAPQPAPDPVSYASAGDRPSTQTLDDGSVVELDVASKIRVQWSREARRVELVSGRAVFTVAHDSARPFTVAAGGGVVTALGTVFQVDRRNREVVVTLLEGTVHVADEKRRGTRAATLAPGEQLRFATVANGSWQKTHTDTAAATSWLRGRHVFRAAPLAEALDEINRYAARKVRLGDPTLASLQVSGNFLRGDSESIVSAFAAVAPLKMIEQGGDIVLLRRYDPDALAEDP